MPNNANRQQAETSHAIYFQEDPPTLTNSVVGKGPVPIVQPSLDSYLQLIGELVNIANNKSDDPLEDYTDALHSVTDYLNKDPAAVSSGALKPLFKLLGVLRDTLAGARPKPLFSREALEKAGRPTDIHEHRINSFITLALALMDEAKIPVDTAVREIVKMSHKHELINTKTEQTYSSRDVAALNRKIKSHNGPAKLVEYHNALLNAFTFRSPHARGSVPYALAATESIIAAAAMHAPDHARRPT